MRLCPRRSWTILILAFAVSTVGLFSKQIETRTIADDEQVNTTDNSLSLVMRRRVETAEGSGRYHAVTEEIKWDPKKTAIVICDMWNQHWCRGATRRVSQMAARMNEVVKKARERGVFIIHCPSGTTKFYENSVQRRLALSAPLVAAKVPLQNWCHLDEKREGGLPIDDSDGGCDCVPQCKQGGPWTRQIATIEIKEGDAITDNAEAYYLMQQRGIDNVIVMGVHTNMCVLGRPFSIRQMIYQGKNVVLMRDMTDTMYNPRREPFVSHFTGTDLVVEHIEKHWCPTITSAGFLSGSEFRFPNDKRPHLVIITAEREYQTNVTLPKFASKQLGKDFRVSHVFANENDRNDLPGLEILNDADLVLISVRRRVLPTAQMAGLRKLIASGKPVIGIRTANHAFSLKGKQPPDGRVAWETFDADVIGGNYVGHHGNKLKPEIHLAASAGNHPILAGVDANRLRSHGSLYRVQPLADSARALLVGSIPDKSKEPVAWTNERRDGGRVFYTSLGHPNDFDNPEFVTLLRNGIYWAAGLNVSDSKTEAVSSTK